MFDLVMQHSHPDAYGAAWCASTCAARIDFIKLYIFYVILFGFWLDRC